MKQIISIPLLIAAMSVAGAKNKSGTFTGEIMDRMCAQMQSHDNMMKAQGAKNAKECALSCVKNGDKFALFDSETKKVYLIDDEKKVRPYAGQRVQIKGTYEENGENLHIESIAPAH